MSTKKKPAPGVLREFPPVGPYQVRLMGDRNPSSELDDNYLEIKDPLTKREVQIRGTKQVILLHEALSGLIQGCYKDSPVTITVKESQADPVVDQRQKQLYAGMLSSVRKATKENSCTSCGIAENHELFGIRFGLCRTCTREGGMKYTFERGPYPNQDVIGEKFFMSQHEAIAYARGIGADHAYDNPSYRNPITVYSMAGRVLPIHSKEERKEVRMKSCTLCQREIPALGPESGIGYKEETLCGVCLKAAQRVCPHALRKEDGVTCRDCGARPWSVGRVAKGLSLFTVKASAQVAKVFVLYTIQAILGSAVTLGLAYFAAKKMGFLP